MTVEIDDPRLPARFWKHIEVLADGCWAWRGTVSVKGYGRYSIKGRGFMAHRAAYEALVGPILAETLDHLCRNRACTNPAHLEPVSTRTNVLRGIGPTANNARKTHCRQGHSYANGNLMVRPSGHRWCRICWVASQERRRIVRKQRRRQARGQ